MKQGQPDGQEPWHGMQYPAGSGPAKAGSWWQHLQRRNGERGIYLRARPSEMPICSTALVRVRQHERHQKQRAYGHQMKAG
jgi:hypothetical protein